MKENVKYELRSCFHLHFNADLITSNAIKENESLFIVQPMKQKSSFFKYRSRIDEINKIKIFLPIIES